MHRMMKFYGRGKVEVAVCTGSSSIAGAAPGAGWFFRNSLRVAGRDHRGKYTGAVSRHESGPCHRFRVTRDADIEIREEEAEDLLSQIQEELRRRRFGTPVRLEVSPDMPADMIGYLRLHSISRVEDVYVFDGPLHIRT